MLALRCAPASKSNATARPCADWLVRHRRDDHWGVNWPTVVSRTPAGEPGHRPGNASPESKRVVLQERWRRSRFLAGVALDDASLRELANEPMHDVHSRPVAARAIPSPTFCHGVAGLLQIVLRFAEDTGLSAFADAATQLVDEPLAALEPERTLGYASLELGGNPVDRAGRSTAAAGIAMVLLAAATDAEPTWDWLFLLS